MLHKNIPLLLLSLFATGAFAQTIGLKARPIEGFTHPALSKNLEAYTVASINVDAMLPELASRKAPGVIRIEAAGQVLFEGNMKPNPVLASNYATIYGDKQQQTVDYTRPEVYTFLSTETAGAQAAFTFAKGYIFGFCEQDGRSWVIEPVADFDAGQPEGLYVIYDRSAVRSGPQTQCGAIEMEEESRHWRDAADRSETDDPNCGPRELEIAIANDYSMTQAFPSKTALLNHNIGLINAAALRWDYELGAPLFFKIVRQYITINGDDKDPWPSTNITTELLPFFRNWANAGGFGVDIEYDNGHWRSRRVIYNPNRIPVAGATYLGAYCSYARYSIFSEASFEDLCELYTTISHEIGHLFNAPHTSPNPPNIMMGGGTVCTDVWAASSVSIINSSLMTATCVTPSASANCPLPAWVDQPDVFQNLTVGKNVCITFDNLCINTFTVLESEPNLTVTVSGRTICMLATGPIFRGQLLIVPLDYCMNGPSLDKATIWFVSADEPQFRPLNNAGKGLSLLTTPEYVRIEDVAVEPLRKLVQIFDASGREFLRETSADATIQIPVSHLPAGLWFAKVSTGGQVLTKRFVKL